MRELERGTGQVILSLGGGDAISLFVSDIAPELPQHLAAAFDAAGDRENPNQLVADVVHHFTDLADGREFDVAVDVGEASSDVDFERPCRVIGVSMTASEDTRIHVRGSFHPHNDDPLGKGVQYWSYEEFVDDFGNI